MDIGKKLLGFLVLLGVALGVVCQMRWMELRGRNRATEGATASETAAAVAAQAVPKVQSAASAAQAIGQTPAPQRPAHRPIANDPKIPKARQVLLANRRIAVATGRSFPKAFCATQTPTVRGTAPYVVISEAPVSRDVRIQAVADGVRVLGFLPNNALLVEADASALKNLEADVLFTAAVEYEPTDKIQRALLEAEDETVEATVSLLNEQDYAAVSDYIRDNGGAALAGRPPSGRVLHVTLPRTLVEKLAGKAEVKWIERCARLRALNDLSVQPACMNVTPVWNLHGLDGSGEVVTLDDTGIDQGSRTTIHPDLADRIVKIADMSGNGTLQDVCGHGTHVAGSLVGSGVVSNGLYAGVAKGAKLYVQAGGDGTDTGEVWFDGLVSDAEIFAPKRLRYGNFITSISLGADSWGEYTYFCYVADEAMWTYPELLVVVANGNAGPSKGSVGEPASAKSCLSVGNSYSTRNGRDPATIAATSSRGPCEDGRIKPEVTAPGTRVISTRSSRSAGSGDYTVMSGTSMATPHVSGAAAIVRQWLRRDRGFDNDGHKPSGALLKAILTGGANGGTVPDNTFGWGRVDLEASICPTNGQAVFLADWLPFAEGRTFTFRVTTTNAAPLCVQLVWNDYPCMPGVAKTLVNDLDLRVTSASEVWLGNGGTAPDEVNTVESVRLPEAAARSYAVSVTCAAVPYDFEEGGAAALYVRGAFDPKDVVRDEKAGTIWVIR